MSQQTLYRQCRLSRSFRSGSVAETVTWIPEEFASVGRVLKLRNEDKSWDDGWRVISVGDSRKVEKLLPDYRKRIRSHRNATGDAITK